MLIEPVVKSNDIKVVFFSLSSSFLGGGILYTFTAILKRDSKS